MKKIKNAFTLVELIIVITILAILATIAFVSFQNYIKDSRDSNRLMSLKNIENGLNSFFVSSGFFPEPDNKVNISASGYIIGYQGNIGNQVSSLIRLNKKTYDPIDNIPYSYSIDSLKTKYQVLSLNEGNSIASLGLAYSGDNSKRLLIAKGNGLGIFVDASNTPIEQTLTGIDIIKTNSTYTVVTPTVKITGTGGQLRLLTATYSKQGFFSYVKSCKEINDAGLSGGDGIYSINPTLTTSGTFQVYCDMTTEGGGWTLLFNMRGLSTYNKSYSGDVLGDFLNKNGISLAYSDLPLGKQLLLEASESEIKSTVSQNKSSRIDIISNIAVEGNTFKSLANSGVANILVYQTGTVTKNLMNLSSYGGDYGNLGHTNRKLCINDTEGGGVGFMFGACPHGNAAGWPDYTNYIPADYTFHWPQYFRVWTK